MKSQLPRRNRCAAGGRLEPLQLALPSPDQDMRTLGPVVQPLASKMVYGVEPQVTKRRAVGWILVSDPGGWSDALRPEELAHQLAGGSRVPPGLHQHLEHLALGIDSPPEVHLIAADPDEHLVQMPAPMRRRAPCPKPTCNGRPERFHPPADRLVRHLNAALGEQVLNVAVAQGEVEVPPDGRWMTSGGKR